MINIFAPSVTPRLEYTLDLIFKNLLGTTYSVTDNKTAFEQSHGPRFTYGESAFENSFFLKASPLLFEKDIRKLEINLFEYDGQVAFFRNEDSRSILPFDLFALVFFLVSRYEEYLPVKRDAHKRFPASQSLAFRGQFLHIPLVNILVSKFGDLLSARYSRLDFPKPRFTFQPTFDIDYAWAYKNKGAARNAAGLFRDLITGEFKAARTRIATLTGVVSDPFFTFDTIFDLHKDLPLKPILFFLLGDRGKYDKNISPKVPAFRELIKKVSNNYPVGIHPSYQSHVSKNQLNKELLRLSTVTAKNVTKSRQHFLKFNLPETYRLLEELGITGEYSMGYAEVPGYRASIANPFPWFDLPANRISNLTVHPFQVMDVSLNQYLGLTPDEAIEKIESMVAVAREAGGQFCSLWHNNSLYFEGPWKGWEKVYTKLIEACVVE